MIEYAFITFEWDDRKAAANEKKHGVTFKEASSVFYDPHALVVADEAHSYEEDRFVIVGLSAVARMLTVCHCYRQSSRLEKQQRTKKTPIGGFAMKAEYDLTNARPNPYIEKLRRPVTLNLDTYAVDYFKREADRTGIPYQRLINMYLVQCAREEKRVEFV